MYCTKCGTRNDDNSYKCVRCGDVLQRPETQPPPASIQNYLVGAILVTLFCCLPFGIPALVYAAQVNGKIQAGDIQGAIDCSNKAKMWLWIAFGLGIATWIICFIIGAVGHR